MGICSWFRPKPKTEPESKQVAPEIISPEVIFQHYAGKRLTTLHKKANPVFGESLVQAKLQVHSIEQFSVHIMLSGKLLSDTEKVVISYFDPSWLEELTKYLVGDEIEIQGKLSHINEGLHWISLEECKVVFDDLEPEEDDTEAQVGANAG